MAKHTISPLALAAEFNRKNQHKIQTINERTYRFNGKHHELLSQKELSSMIVREAAERLGIDYNGELTTSYIKSALMC
jgi:hypothetical protein